MARYSIHDACGAPQSGIDVQDFDAWEDVRDYLDANPDVVKRIEEGRALILKDGARHVKLENMEWLRNV